MEDARQERGDAGAAPEVTQLLEILEALAQRAFGRVEVARQALDVAIAERGRASCAQKHAQLLVCSHGLVDQASRLLEAPLPRDKRAEPACAARDQKAILAGIHQQSVATFDAVGDRHGTGPRRVGKVTDGLCFLQPVGPHACMKSRALECLFTDAELPRPESADEGDEIPATAESPAHARIRVHHPFEPGQRLFDKLEIALPPAARIALKV